MSNSSKSLSISSVSPDVMGSEWDRLRRGDYIVIALEGPEVYTNQVLLVSDDNEVAYVSFFNSEINANEYAEVYKDDLVGPMPEGWLWRKIIRRGDPLYDFVADPVFFQEQRVPTV